MAYVFYKSNNKILQRGNKFLCYDPEVFEWYTLTENDCTYLAQGGWNRTIIQSITTDEENIIIPSTLAGYPVSISIGIIPNTVKRLGFDNGTYNEVGLSLSNNSTLLGIYNAPSTLNNTYISNCTALKKVELDKVTYAGSNHVITGCSSLEVLSQVNAQYNGTSLTRLWSNNNSGEISSFPMPEQVTDFSYGLYKNGITEFTIDSTWDHLTSFDNALSSNPITKLTLTTDIFGDLGVVGGRKSGAYQSSIGTSAENLTFVVNYQSEMYDTIRYIQSTEDYACRNLRLQMLDRHPIKNISFWGDSLTRRNEIGTSHGYMVEQFHDYTAEDVMSWNYGRGGVNSSYLVGMMDAQPQRMGDLSVIWLGTNDTGIGGQQTIANIKAGIAKLTGNYIVLMPWGWGYDADNINAFNNAGFGDLLLNPHEYVIQHGFDVLGKIPTATEQSQIANDEIPDIYIDTSDHTHLTRYAGQVISTAIKEKLISLGYITNDWLSLKGQNTSVTISTQTLSVSVGNTGTLTATSGNGASITWSSTNENIATVSNGTVTGVASGECFVIARCGSYSKFCTVTVI